MTSQGSFIIFQLLLALLEKAYNVAWGFRSGNLSIKESVNL